MDVIAERTESRLTRDLILDAVPYDFQELVYWARLGTYKFFSQHSGCS